MPLRLIFMGTPEFSVPTLLELVAHGHEIAAVYTRAPKPGGRGMKLQPSPVEVEARRLIGEEPVVIAGLNSERQTVISGARDAVVRLGGVGEDGAEEEDPRPAPALARSHCRDAHGVPRGASPRRRGRFRLGRRARGGSEMRKR